MKSSAASDALRLVEKAYMDVEHDRERRTSRRVRWLPTNSFRQTSWPGRAQTPTVLLLITPYGAPANCTQCRASLVVSITAEDDLRAAGGMNRSLPTGGSAYGMPFHETTLFGSVSDVEQNFEQTQADKYVPSFWRTP